MTGHDPFGPVSIGLPEIYALARQAVDQGTLITAKLDLFANRQDNTAQDVDDHETRIRALERNRWPAHLLSIAIAAAALAAAVFLKK